MSAKKTFLPSHPKILRKVPHNYQTTQSSFTYDTSPEEQRIIEELIQFQKNNIRTLQAKIHEAQQKNANIQTALQFYKPETQIDQVQAEISKLRAYQDQLEQKIKNCQTVEKTTTVEEYYLWQKKQIIEDHEERVNQMTSSLRQQKETLTEDYHEKLKLIEETKRFIKDISIQMGELQRSNTQAYDPHEDNISISEIEELREEQRELDSTTQLLRENHQILNNQIINNMQANQRKLQSAFESYKNNLIKSIGSIKAEIINAQITPPTTQDYEFRSQPYIQEYQAKILQFRDKVNPKLRESAGSILRPKPTSTIDWRSYLDQGEKNEESTNNEEEYKKAEKEYYDNEEGIRHHEEELRNIINDTVIYQQKNHEIEGAIKEILKMGIMQLGK